MLRADRHTGRRPSERNSRHGERARIERAELLAGIVDPVVVPFVPGSRVGYVVHPATGCWLWIGALADNGYGVAGIPGTSRARVAHLQSFVRSRGAVPAGLELDHTCRRRYCVNPDHLEPVTRTINVRRGAKTKLNPAKVRLIRHVFSVFQNTMELTESLAIGFGVSVGAITDVRYRRNWKDVPDTTAAGVATFDASGLPQPERVTVLG